MPPMPIQLICVDVLRCFGAITVNGSRNLHSAESKHRLPGWNRGWKPSSALSTFPKCLHIPNEPKLTVKWGKSRNQCISMSFGSCVSCWYMGQLKNMLQVDSASLWGQTRPILEAGNFCPHSFR